MSREPERRDNPEWRATLLGTDPQLVRLRRIFRHIPSDPRCKMCLSPQGGIGGPLVQLFGFGRYPQNPQLCNSCFRSAQQHPGGAEIEITALFADIRGSTGLAETMSASAYSAAVDEYVRAASRAIRDPGGLVDKLLGDGIMALFISGFVGENHGQAAVDAARTMLRSVSLPVGVGIHTGPAWVGFVGGIDGVFDFTALGDAVNVASRLGSEAGAGELLLSGATASAAGLDTSTLEARRLELRGRDEPVDAWAQRITKATAVTA
ncbi:MAG TPA: adenylate/guanylate cyclase domain-containing protein [Candidatus Angelobacter sp.]|nr:adenylate/guanylate cyclase domain-containing protein [Candidatus Angelobacter sp.]